MARSENKPTATTTGAIPLPPPGLVNIRLKGTGKQAIGQGDSDEPMSLAALSQLLWAAQGVTRKMDKPDWWTGTEWQGNEGAPSAGALYPLEVYVVAGNVEGLDPACTSTNP